MSEKRSAVSAPCEWWAVLVAALHFFSSDQHRLQIAHLTVDELARLANTDELTQLASRRGTLLHRADEALHATKRGGRIRAEGA